jgi:hypothetical protein
MKSSEESAVLGNGSGWTLLEAKGCGVSGPVSGTRASTRYVERNYARNKQKLNYAHVPL